MRRSLRLLLVLGGLCVLYLLIFPMTTGAELGIDREWALSASLAPVEPAGGSIPLTAVRLVDSFAYISADGRVRFRAPAGQAVALAGFGYIQYGRTTEQLVLQSPSGSYVAGVPQIGYPEFTENGLFVRSGDDTVVTAYTADGTYRWSVEVESAVGTIRTDGGVTVLGLLSGGIAIVDSDGTRVGLQGFSQSQSLTAYATAVDAGSGAVAAMFGPADPELVVFQPRSNGLVPTLRVPLRQSPGTVVPLEYADNGTTLVFYDGTVRIVQTASASESSVQVEFPVRQIRTGSSGHLLAALEVGDDPDPSRGFRRPARLTLFDRDGSAPVTAAFASHSVSILPMSGTICLSMDERVLSFTVGDR